jgi:hypothetical protein
LWWPRDFFMLIIACGPVAERKRRDGEPSHILVRVQAGPPIIQPPSSIAATREIAWTDGFGVDRGVDVERPPSGFPFQHRYTAWRSRLSVRRVTIQRLQEGAAQAVLARTYGVSQATISLYVALQKYCI